MAPPSPGSGPGACARWSSPGTCTPPPRPGIDQRLLLSRLATRYPDCYTFACAGLVGATPELLIRRQGRQISSLVLAGTMPRGRNRAEDAALGAALLASAKDAEEHEYAAAGVREALAPLCDHLAVEEQPSLLRLADVQHLATAVTGRLAAARHPGGVRSVLALVACPAPDRGGLRNADRDGHGTDPRTRGHGPGPLRWAGRLGGHRRKRRMGHRAALRARLDGPRARLFAGCGIVAGSDPAAELAEAQAKFRPMRYAVEGLGESRPMLSHSAAAGAVCGTGRPGAE